MPEIDDEIEFEARKKRREIAQKIHDAGEKKQKLLGVGDKVIAEDGKRVEILKVPSEPMHGFLRTTWKQQYIGLIEAGEETRPQIRFYFPHELGSKT